MARKLTTILSADVAGYSRLVAADEAGTIAALHNAREVVDRLVADRHGRIFGSAGDSIVAEFGSAVDAVEAAIAIQRTLDGTVPKQSATERLRFRIGLNIGDVVIDGDNLMGDGVNVASRIEALAEPGGISLSRSVFEQVRGKVSAVFEPLGRQALKNIHKPVMVYRVALDGRMRPFHVRYLAQAKRHAAAIGVIAAAALIVVTALIWEGGRTVKPIRAKASIAVLPLATFDDDATTRRLAGGLAEDVIANLSRFGDLEIVASDSAKAVIEKSRDVSAIGRELNVAYVLQGAIQHEADTYRVTAKLVDAASSTYVWSQQWDYTGIPTFDLQREIAERIATTLGSAEASAALTGSEIRKANTRPPANLQAYDLYLLAVEARGRFTKEAVFGGIEYATKAIALDPGFARAYAMRARLHFNTTHYGADFETAMQAMEADALKAVDLAPNDPECRASLAWYYATRGLNKEAETELQTALATNPANVSLMKMAASTYAFAGRAEEGAALADKVLRLDPLATAGTLNTIKDAYFFARRFEDTVTVVTRVSPDARSRGSKLLLALSLALLDRKKAAHQAREDLLQAHPNISAELLANQGWKFERPEEQKLLLEGFAAAGLPICASAADLAKLSKPERLPGCPSL